MKRKAAAKYLRKRFGYCKDKNFQVGCVCCEVSRVIRLLEDREQPVSDAIMQRLMADDCPDHDFREVEMKQILPAVDLYLDIDPRENWEEFSDQSRAIVTLRNGNQCWTPWVHQSRYPGWDCELRYASGDEVRYMQDGIYCGAERGYDIVAIERGVTANEARARGLKELDWPGGPVAT